MKRANMLLVCSILVVMLACSLMPSAGQEPKHYDNGVFSFDYPPDWIVVHFEAPRADPFMLADEILQVKLEKSSASMHIYRRPSIPGTPMQDLAEATYSQWDDLQVPWQPESSGTLQIDNRPAYEKYYLRPWGEPWNRFRDVWLGAGEQVYILSCTATKGSFEDHQDACDTIVGSFQVKAAGEEDLTSAGTTVTPPVAKPPATLPAGEGVQLSMEMLPPGARCQFESDGDLFAGWYWLRDSNYQAFSEWRCAGLPQGVDLPLTLLALVTNQASGGSGYSTPAKLTLTNPSTQEAEGVQIYLQNPLPEQNPADSGGRGYLASSYLVVPARFIGSEGSLRVRIERLSPNPYHLAVNSETLRVVPPRQPASMNLQGDLISGWYWLRDAKADDHGGYQFNSLVSDATLSILTLNALVTQGTDGGSGYSMPVEITLANPSSGEQVTMDFVQAQNLLFGANPDYSGGYGYQTYASILFESRLIGEDGSLMVHIQRPSGAEYHLALNENSLGMVQFGGQRPDVAGGVSDQPTPGAPTDQASCEAQGGKWGPLGLFPKEVCNLPTTDAGKACSDSSQCQSACVAELTQEQFNDVFRNGAVIEKNGACAAWSILVGCIPVVRDGVVQVICLD